MAISDINKMMAMYAQPTEFDQNAWKKAFDIANAFTGAENSRTIANENARKHQENLATQDWRVKFQNNEYETGIGTNNVNLADLQRRYSNALQTDPSSIQSTIAQNNFNTTQYKIGEQGILGQHEAAKLVARYGFDKNGNAVALPQVFKNATADGYNPTNPYATSSFYQAGNQERANQQALSLGIANNSMGTTIDAAGNVVSTGQIDPQKLTNNLNMMVATGMITKEQADNLRKGFSIEVPHQEIKRFQPILNPQPQIISPYRLDAQPQQTVNTSTAFVQPVVTEQAQNSQPTQIDYVSMYGVSQPTLDLIKRQAALNNMDIQEALKQNASRLALAKNGQISQEALNAFILRNIEDEMRSRAIRTKADEISRSLDPNIFGEASYIR